MKRVPTNHPLSRTAIDLRRAIFRMEQMEEHDPTGFEECGGREVLRNLIKARKAIPSDYIDVDKKE